MDLKLKETVLGAIRLYFEPLVSSFTYVGRGLMALNNRYDSINNEAVRLIICLVVVSPLLMMIYPPLILRFGVAWIYSCAAWTGFITVVRWWWLTQAR